MEHGWHDICSRGPEGCRGDVFMRTSRSGLTRSFICQGHSEELERALDAIAYRYPEINHPEYCGCHGCTGDPYTDPREGR